MDWTRLMYLPAAVALFWPLAIFVGKKHPTRAQLLLSMSMLMQAFCIVLGMVIFRRRTQSLFVYQFLFEVVAMLVGPVYYIAVCALSEARGTTLRQRHSLLLPLCFVAVLPVLASSLGLRRYEQLCRLFFDGALALQPGDVAWNLMALWSYPVFIVLMEVVSLALLFMASRKCRIFRQRFNSYYSATLNAPRLDSRPAHWAAWTFLPISAVATALLAFRPPHPAVWYVALAAGLTLQLFFLGRFTYSLNYDARHLANLVKGR